jgi:CPA1 family monovalent cation:H+ antiporter
VSSLQILIVLCVASVTFTAVAVLRQVGIPAPVVLVVAGLVIGFLPFVPDVSLQPDVVLLGLLPLLVFDAAVTSSPTGFLRDARSIGTLAVLLVVATASVVAVVAHWIGHLSWAMAFVLGTAVGPTDAAAATSVARRLGLPRRLLTILEGEALFNDATALVLYAAAVTAAVSGRFSVAHTAGSILYSTVVGTAIGLAVGFIGRQLRNRIDDPPIEIAGSILLAYVSYLPAEELHASGVLAAVSAGLYLGWHSSSGAFSARSRLQSNAFWETLVFLVNAALFVLVGLSFHTFSVQARGPLGRLVLTCVVVAATVIVVRLIWMWMFGWVSRPVGSPRRGSLRSGWRERLIIGWSGMRGAITLAALLAVPTTTDAGGALGGRNDIIYIGFAVILATLVGQGMTLPALVRRLHLRESPTVVDTEREARVELAQVALDYIGKACENGDVPEELSDGLRAQYLGRLRRLETSPAEEDLEAEVRATAETEVTLRRELIALQRRTLIVLRDEGRIGVSTLRTVEHDLDLEEARLASA